MSINRDHVAIAAIMLLAAIASVLLAWLISVNSTRIETELLNELAQDELEELATIVRRDPDTPLPRTDMVEVWLENHWDSEPLPAVFENLQLGSHYRLSIGDQTYHVLHDRIAGRDAVIAINLTPFQARKAILRNLLVIIALLAPMATAFMAIYYLSRRLNPVIDMARRVSELEPSKRGVRLAHQFRDGEMQVIARAFDSYQERLDQFVEREQSFCEAASHELRTPLATLSAGTEVLVAESKHFSPRTMLTIERMQRTAEHMSSLLNGLMWLVREDEVPNHEVVRLGRVIRLQAEHYAPVIEQKNIRFRFDDSNAPTVNIPVGHFEIVLGNILRNAVQHTPAGGLIEIRFVDTSVVIQDTGKGIDDQTLDRIFARDFRDRNRRGGLGLYLSLRICLFHGWKLDIHSDTERGTRVTIDLGEDVDSLPELVRPGSVHNG